MKRTICLRNRFKSILLCITGLGLFICVISYLDTFAHNDRLVRHKNERRIASIEGKELEAILSQAKARNSIIINQPTNILPHPPRPPSIRNAMLISNRKNMKYRGGYASRITIEDVTIPDAWSESPNLVEKLKERKEKVKQTCKKYNLDKPSLDNKPNAWEYIYSEKYNLLWCPVFKSASSSWMFNFNLLAGYSEEELYKAKDTPISLARKKYPRMEASDLYQILNKNDTADKPLTFMITRHPYERIVSAFRDKIQTGNRYYKKLFQEILRTYPELRSEADEEEKIENIKDPLERARKRLKMKRIATPSFPQFVQFVINAYKRKKTMNEHWETMNHFCTPCLVDIDVFAKVESLDEDANYIIFHSGIEHVIKPKKINSSKKGPTNSVAKSYLCQLSEEQRRGLADVYKYDLELFDYNPHFNCSVT